MQRPYIDLATEAIRSTESIEPIEPIEPTDFYDLILHLATHRIPITREGTERLMDTLLARHTLLLADPTTHQTVLGSLLAPVATPAFAAYWTYIMIPAWDHHAVLYRLLRETAE